MHPEMNYSIIRRADWEGELLVVATSRLASLEKIIGGYSVIGTIRGECLYLCKMSNSDPMNRPGYEGDSLQIPV